ELGAEDATKRPTVQIGDPFEEKKLLECSLELLDRGLLVALQDLGAAGMTSESQERMLCVVEPARVDDAIAVCERWEVNATAIGVVTDTGRLRVLAGDEVVGDLPVAALVDECPAYDLEPAAPGVPLYPAPEPVLAEDAGPQAALLALLGSPNLASRRWAFEQY